MRLRALFFDLDDTLTDRHRSIARYTPYFVERFASDLDAVSIETLVHTLERADGGGYRPKEEMFAELCEVLPWRQTPAISVLRLLYCKCDNRLKKWWSSVKLCDILG